MKKQRMEIGELRELLKSGPVELECDDGEFNDNCKTVTVLGIGETDYFRRDGLGREDVSSIKNLKHYPSKKQVKTVKMVRTWFLSSGRLHYDDQCASYNSIREGIKHYCTCCDTYFDVDKILEVETLKEFEVE